MPWADANRAARLPERSTCRQGTAYVLGFHDSSSAAQRFGHRAAEGEAGHRSGASESAERRRACGRWQGAVNGAVAAG